MPSFVAGIGLVQSLQSLSSSNPCIQIKVLRTGHPPRRMVISEAIILAKTVAFQGAIAKSGKVRFIREVERPQSEWRECWGTTQAAVLPPPPNPRVL